MGNYKFVRWFTYQIFSNMTIYFPDPGILCGWEQLESVIFCPGRTQLIVFTSWFLTAGCGLICLAYLGYHVEPRWPRYWSAYSVGNLALWVGAGMWGPYALIGGNMSFMVGTCWQVRKIDFLHGTPQRFPKVTGFPQNRKCIQWSKGLDCSRLWTSIATSRFAVFKLIVKDGLSMFI